MGMRIAVMVNDDLFSCIALNHLAPYLQGHEVWLGCTSRVGASPTPATPTDPNPCLDQWRFLEQGLPMRTLFPKLQALPLTGSEQWLTTVQLARQHAWPLTLIESLNTPGLLYTVKTFAPDVMLSIRFGKIFKGPWLTVARHGILNLHSGLLPDFRGVLATFWTLLQQRAEYGCTLHWIDDGQIDTGGVVHTVRMPVQPGQSLFAHIASLYQPGMQAMGEAVQRLAHGQRPASHPQQGEPQYFSYPTAADFERFLGQGGSLVDWAEYGEVLRRFGPDTASGPAHA